MNVGALSLLLVWKTLQCLACNIRPAFLNDMTNNRLKIILFWLFALIFAGNSSLAQINDSTLLLKDEKPEFSTNGFHIVGVEDERSDPKATARLLMINNSGTSISRVFHLKGGDVFAIKNFIIHNFNQTDTLKPVVLTLKQFQLTESLVSNNGIAGKLAMECQFGLQREYGVVTPLITYKGGYRYTRSASQNEIPETILRKGILNAMSFFNNWLTQHLNTDIRLARAVKVNFTDYTEQPEGDTIYYSALRPITWSDFQDKPRAGNFEAEVFTGIGFNEQTVVENGLIKLTIAVKVYLPKSAAWAKGDKDSYALDHEQRHFDIAKIIGEHFKQKIAAMVLAVWDYDGFINEQYLETLREQTRMQNQYDRETRHGMDREEQEIWDKRIDNELKLLRVK